MGRKTSLEKIVDHIRDHYPKRGKAIDLPLCTYNYDDVYEAIDMVKDEYPDLRPYDLPGNKFMWNLKNGHKNYELAREMTCKLIQVLKKKRKKKNLEEVITMISMRDFGNHPINRFGTTPLGMLHKVYSASPYNAIIDLVKHNKEFKEFRDMQPYDMKNSPHIWISKNAKKYAREIISKSIDAIMKEEGIKDFLEVLPILTQEKLRKTKINKYGTTAMAALDKCYKGSPYLAVKDYIDSNKKLEEFKDIKPYDMICAPIHTWQKNGTKNYKLAREVIEKAINTIRKNNNLSRKQVITLTTSKELRETEINKYGATAGTVLRIFYGNSKKRAFFDWAQNTPKRSIYVPLIKLL